MKNSNQHRFTNQLINETSPYLLQHAHNPVEWYPWGEKALEKARNEDKLIIVSVGYSACHWCHVMEHESFENEEVAKIMNDNFVCIKVDREERPDVDNVYMDAVHIMGQQGGWPLNCIALPDGRPVFGGTYFPKANWIQLLEQMSLIYKEDKEKMLDYASRLTEGLEKQALLHVEMSDTSFKAEDINLMVREWEQSFDWKWGGSKGSPKFPMPNGIAFLLQHYYFTENKTIKDYLELTLDKMASGGIYDHVGGGFARYSTDLYWKVPHFEKMLYDNAQLVSVYAQAYKLFKKNTYKQVVQETLLFLERELKDKKGGYYSALDADSEGVEGKFYVWSYHDIVELLKENSDMFSEYYTVRENGNWEHGINVIHNEIAIEKLAKKHNKSIEEVERILSESKKILFEARKKRVRPATDTKILTSWNSLLISAYIDAYKALGKEEYIEEALAIAEYLRDVNLTKDGKVNRMLRSGKNHIPGFLDDYGLLAQAFIDLYEATFDEEWLQHSKNIVDYAILNFYDSKSGMFYFSDKNDKELFATKQEITDNVIPSSNSVMANVLFRLGIHFGIAGYSSKSKKMVAGIYSNISKHGAYFSNWAILLNQFIYHPPEVVFAGRNAFELTEEWNKIFLYSHVAGATKQSDLPLLKNRLEASKTLIYVCRNRVCDLPVTKIEDALKQIGNRKK